MFFWRMRMGQKHTCARTDALQRMTIFAVFSCVFLSAQISGRKQLSSNGGFERENSIVAGSRAPLYEDKNNLNNLYDHQHTESYLNSNENSNFHLGGQNGLKQAKYAYVVKRKPGAGRNNGKVKLYRIAGVKPTSHENSDLLSRSNLQATVRPPLLYYSAQSTPYPEVDIQDTTEGKKYAFAYAVRPKDGYTSVGDDFNLSHKESRDGKVTMGEYKVLLPDGRLQVVRYTADGKSGFKADVTYEGEGAEAHSQEKHEHYAPQQLKPKSGAHHQHYLGPSHSAPPHLGPSYSAPKHLGPSASAPPYSGSSPSGAPHLGPSPSGPPHFGPLPSAPPAFKARTFGVSTGVKTPPSLSPSLYYEGYRSPPGSREHDSLEHSTQHVQYTPPTYNPSPSPPQTIYKISTPRPKINSKSIQNSAGYSNFKRAILGSTLPSFLKNPLSTPNSIYDKINHNHQTPNYVPVTRGQRAGPATHPTDHAYSPPKFHPTYPPAHGSPPSPDLYSKYPTAQKHAPFSGNSGFSYDQQRYQLSPNFISSTIGPDTYSPNSHVQYQSFPYHSESYPSAAPKQLRKLENGLDRKSQNQYSKSGLLSPELFRAGPDSRLTPGHDEHPFNFGQLNVQGDHGHHYILEEVHDEDHHLQVSNPSRLLHEDGAHHYEISNSQAQYSNLPALKSSVSTNSLNSATPRPELYAKTKTNLPVGLVYLETPATGLRPTALGVQKFLSQIPHGNLPRPKTTTHPYELGSRDYGNNVGYSPIREFNSGGSYKTIRSTFKPSQEIPPEYHPYQAHGSDHVLSVEESKIVANSQNVTKV